MAYDIEIKIERGVPMPATMGLGISNALRNLATHGQIGDSIFISGKSSQSLNGILGNLKFRAGWQVSRTVEGGVRVWKKSEPEPRS